MDGQQIPVNEYIQVLAGQRNGALDACAQMQARLIVAEALIAALKKELSELKPPT